ncbi:hypothetical protein [Rhizobium ruizarguesonis]|nr:hypothetical protein [Rhizobium ruizarguesonis]
MSGFLCGMDPAVVAPIAVIVAVADHVIFRRKSRWLLMTDVSQLLQIAVEDNVAWCCRICSAHGSNETRRSEAWANFGISPPFYPNIITRQKGVQKEVDDLTRKVREANKSTKWGIKDSFADLTLADQGFERLLVGRWYGGSLSKGTPTGWKAVASSGELRSWEKAWGSCDDTIFPNTLLEDYRITFWFKGELSGIEAGFISYDTGFSLGLSNWFSRKNSSFAQMGVLQAARSVSQGLPIVCWSTDDLTLEHTGLIELGTLQVWISQ